MYVQTAVIQIDGSADGAFIVAHHILFVDKAGKVFIYPHAVFQKFPVIGNGDHVNIPFIIDARRYDAHIHPAHGCLYQAGLHALIQYQIRRGNVDIIPGFVYHAGINTLHGIIGRPVRSAGERLYKAFILCAVERAEIFRMILTAAAALFPHCQKYIRKAPYGLTFKTHGRILPVPETDYAVYIFISQINAARISHGGIYYRYLLMIPVVEG